MYTLEDIKPLVMVEGAKAVMVREKRENRMPDDLKNEFAKQIRKATKLPVIFVPEDVEVTVSAEELK